MNIEELREYCLAKPGATESFPFDETTLVFKVADKIFALIDLDDNSGVNLKCDPEKAVELRERYAGVSPGYHMNKKHWNTVMLSSSYDDKFILGLVDHSYDLVLKSVSAKKRNELGL
jgi:predicted DNA-binding protein (MmcQ/YjbR family)